MTCGAVDGEELLVHDWRVDRLTGSAFPGRWPRSAPTASTGAGLPG